MNQHGTALALAEPDLSAASNADAGQSLILATDEIYYRTKAADVWWMLRDIVGDLRTAAGRWRSIARRRRKKKSRRSFSVCWSRPPKRTWSGSSMTGSIGDHGLPDLSIAAVVPRQVLGKDSEYLVAVEVSTTAPPRLWCR